MRYWWAIPVVGGIGYLVYKHLQKPQREGPPVSDVDVEFGEDEAVTLTSSVSEISERVAYLQGVIDTMAMALEQAVADYHYAFTQYAGLIPIGGDLITPAYAYEMTGELPAPSVQHFPILANSGVCGKVTEAYWRIMFETLSEAYSLVRGISDSRAASAFRNYGLAWEPTATTEGRIAQAESFLDFYDRYPQMLNSGIDACIWLLLGQAVRAKMPMIRRLWEYTGR